MLRGNVVLSTLSGIKTDLWYLDSKCSRHMMAKKPLFTNIFYCNEGKVTFTDGATAKIVVKIQ